MLNLRLQNGTDIPLSMSIAIIGKHCARVPMTLDFVNSLPAEYDMVVAVHTPIPDYSAEAPFKRFESLFPGHTLLPVADPVSDFLTSLGPLCLANSAMGSSLYASAFAPSNSERGYALPRMADLVKIPLRYSPNIRDPKRSRSPIPGLQQGKEYGRGIETQSV